jgi:hypothetical protein
VAILSEVRSLLQDGLGDIAASLRRVERGAWKISRVAPICPRARALPPDAEGIIGRGLG